MIHVHVLCQGSVCLVQVLCVFDHLHGSFSHCEFVRCCNSSTYLRDINSNIFLNIFSVLTDTLAKMCMNSTDSHSFTCENVEEL